MLQQELLIHVVDVLDSNHLDYMITGSVASSIQGEPRLTHDIDIVTMTVPQDKIPVLKKAFPEPEYYLDERSILEANQQRSMFNLLEMSTGNKVDFRILTDDAFDQSRFARKYSITYSNRAIKLCSPEDTILVKLRWSKLSGGSEKQIVDALRIYELQKDHLDIRYLNQWVTAMELNELWDDLKSRAQ